MPNEPESTSLRCLVRSTRLFACSLDGEVNQRLDCTETDGVLLLPTISVSVEKWTGVGAISGIRPDMEEWPFDR